MACLCRERIGRTTQLGYPYLGLAQARVSMGMGMGSPAYTGVPRWLRQMKGRGTAQGYPGPP